MATGKRQIRAPFVKGAVQESSSGGPLLRLSILVDPEDLAILVDFGEGNVATGIHKAANMVRAKLILDAIENNGLAQPG